MTLHVGGRSFALRGITTLTGNRYAPADVVVNLGWTQGQKVSLRLTVPASSVTVGGVTLSKFKAIPGDDRIELRWNKLGYIFCGYEVDWREAGSTEWQSYEYTTLGGTKTAITGLKPGTSYDVRLYVKSGYENKPRALAFETTVSTTGTAMAPPAPPPPAPALSWARVNGAELALRFDAALDGSSVPAASAFAVSVAGAARGVSAVSVSGETATLTLASAVTAGQAVTVGYTPPPSGKLRRAGGGDVAAFSGHSVTNDTPAAQQQQQQQPETTERPAPAPLTASVSSAPSEHRGKGRFAVRIAFSEAVTAKAKDAGVQVTGGSLLRAARVDGRKDLWELRIAPSSSGAVTVTLPATSDCAASGAICTADGRRLESALTRTVAGPALPALTASVSSAPSAHRGAGKLALRIAFSEAVTAKAKDAGVRVSGGTLSRAVRVDGRKDLWELRVQPSGRGAVTVTLPATTDCAAAGAVCTADGRKLETALTHAVQGPLALSVADARAQEGPGASVDFAVTLSRAASRAVKVHYATRDGTAKKGKDYSKAKGTLTFAAGETAKTVSVAVLDDAHDEGAETFRLVLHKPKGAPIADGEATGTITNSDPLQQDWLARFGRAAASDAIAAVTARLETPRDAGSHLTLGGHRLSLDGSGAGLPPAPVGGPGGAHWLSWSEDPEAGATRTMDARTLLMGTSFRAVLGQGAGSQFTSWGQGASVSRFSGTGPGLSLSGETATGSLGMDYERGRFLTGFAMTHSLGEGTAHGAGRSYLMGSAVTTMLPYARLALSERVSAWGMAGTGSGQLTLDLDGGASERYRADLSMTLAAAGVRGELVTPAEAGGFALALKADAFWVRTESDSVSAPGVGNLAAARADATRLRAVLDGSRTFALAGGATLTPRLELGVRQDGGDAETGTGMEIGAGVGYVDPSRGVDMALRVHGLAGHAEDGYEEWGVSGSLRLVPGGEGRGLALSVTPSYGADPGGSERLWAMPDATALAANDNAAPSSRLDAEAGYGMALFGGGFTGTPNVGFGLSDTARELRMGWRLSPAGAVAGDFSFSIDAARRDSAGDKPEHVIGFGVTSRW